MSKILITGAGGYIGSITTQLFLSRGYSVIGVDAFLTGYRQPLELLKSQFPETFSWYEANVADVESMNEIFSEHKDIQAVVHFGASCVVKESMEFPEKYFDNNVYGSMMLFQAMHAHGVKNIVFSSTCAVYGTAQYTPLDEAHPLGPSNPYGESKRMVEEMIRWYAELHKTNAIVFRYFNVYGASDDSMYGYSKKPCTHLVDAAVQGALNLHTFTLTCGNTFDTPDGTPVRDYLHVLDLADAHVRAVDTLIQASNPIYETINLGTGTGNTVLEIVQIIETELGVTLSRSIGEVREGEDARLVAANKKANTVLGWQPTRTIHDSLPSMVQWYKTHPKGWEK